MLWSNQKNTPHEQKHLEMLVEHSLVKMMQYHFVHKTTALITTTNPILTGYNTGKQHIVGHFRYSTIKKFTLFICYIKVVIFVERISIERVGSNEMAMPEILAIIFNLIGFIKLAPHTYCCLSNCKFKCHSTVWIRIALPPTIRVDH